MVHIKFHENRGSFSPIFNARMPIWAKKQKLIINGAGTARVQGLITCGELWREEPIVHVKFGENRDPFSPIFNARMLICA